SKLSQYANAHVDHIACSEDYIYIRFKEGYGSTYDDSFSQELYVTTIKEMKEACKKSNLLAVADWTAQEAVNEITEAFESEAEIDSYLDEKFNELSPEAKDRIESYNYISSPETMCIPSIDYMQVWVKDGLLSTYEDYYEKPQEDFLLTFEELEQGKLIEATKPEYFVKDPDYSEITLGPYLSYENPKESILMESTIHRVQELTQTV
ncbi:MAG: hypothetical protein K2H85_02390, partial [Allobaculum sp.]|nr:hypothetical protein [Allobaculum sp.]